jgi:hypothetical protein
VSHLSNVASVSHANTCKRPERVRALTWWRVTIQFGCRPSPHCRLEELRGQFVGVESLRAEMLLQKNPVQNRCRVSTQTFNIPLDTAYHNFLRLQRSSSRGTLRPITPKEGDIIIVAEGSRVPLILRTDTEGEEYLFVGVC